MVQSLDRGYAGEQSMGFYFGERGRPAASAAGLLLSFRSFFTAAALPHRKLCRTSD